MKKIWYVVIALLLLLFVVYRSLVGTYNSLVLLDEGVNAAWSQVENQYQRRLDLIPNLVETVKGYASHEKETFENVAEARASAGRIQLSAEMLNDPAAMAGFEAAQSSLSGALSRLMAVAENYPQLKANQNFMDLQNQLEGTENRISVERRRFNEAVQNYNRTLRRFPTVMIAGIFGFEQKTYFESQAGAESAPSVKF